MIVSRIRTTRARLLTQSLSNWIHSVYKWTFSSHLNRRFDVCVCLRAFIVADAIMYSMFPTRHRYVRLSTHTPVCPLYICEAETKKKKSKQNINGFLRRRNAFHSRSVCVWPQVPWRALNCIVDGLAIVVFVFGSLGLHQSRSICQAKTFCVWISLSWYEVLRLISERANRCLRFCSDRTKLGWAQ